MFPTDTLAFMAVEPAHAADFTVLPGGSAAVAGGLVIASPRGRMLEAMAQAVAVKGYAGATVADVVSRAGVSRKTFYEHFTDKEDCFLAACEYVGSTLLDTVSRAVAAAETPYERLVALVRSYLRALAASPRGAIAFIIEARAATPKIRAHHRGILERFAALLSPPGAKPVDADDAQLRLAGIIAAEDLAAYEIAEGRIDRLPELEDTLIKLAVRMTGVAPPARTPRRRGAAAAARNN